MTIIKEARDMAAKLSSDEIKSLTQGRKRTDAEHLAFMIALEGEIDIKVANKKASAAVQERQEDADKAIARTIYEQAKERFRQEKKRHQLVEAEFVKEKASHKVERDRHAEAVARFQRDAEPWRKMERMRKEAKRIGEIEDDQAFDEGLERLKARLSAA